VRFATLIFGDAVFIFGNGMDWDDLKHFLAVARTGSLTEAARALKAGAATVGRHIDSLETRLGARLFEHRSTGYVVTDLGRGLLVHAEAVEGAVLALEREAASKDLGLHGKVRIATTEDIASMVIIPNLKPFIDKHPGIAIEIVSGSMTVNLTRRDADLAIRSVRPDGGDLLMRRIGGVDLGVYAARSYAEVRGLTAESFDFAKVETITWIEEMAGLRGGPWLAEHAAAARVALQVNSSRLICAACVAGLGVAILPCFGGDPERELVCLVPPEDVQTFDLWLVVHRDLATMPRVRAVMEYLATLGPKFSRQRIAAEADWS
jgi:DNA-binding transcriptional LysR family regulator